MSLGPADPVSLPSSQSMDLRGGFMLEPEFVRGGHADQS
jgi:hypothetical protein